MTTNLTAETVESAFKWPMIIAALLVVPDLILEEQPLSASWSRVATIGDWLIWLVFAVEFGAVVGLAQDRRSWLRRNPLAVAVLVLTPPFAPAALQGVRAFRLLRLLRVARGWELVSKLFTVEGLKYLATLAVLVVLGGGVAFADVESQHSHHLSAWEGIWWAVGMVSTEGSSIQVKTDAGRAISIALMILGIGLFSTLTGVVAQRFIGTIASQNVAKLSEGEERILNNLAELSDRLDRIELSLPELEAVGRDPLSKPGASRTEPPDATATPPSSEQ